jgi:hypothetical protein
MQTQTHTQVHTAYQCASTIVPSPVYHCRCTSVPVFARTRVRDSQCANTFVPGPLYQYPPVRVGQCANTCVPVPLLVYQPCVPVPASASRPVCQYLCTSTIAGVPALCTSTRQYESASVPIPVYQCVPVPLLVSQPCVPVRVSQSANTCVPVPFPVTVWHCLFLFTYLTYHDSDTRVLVAHASSGTKAAVVGGGGWRVVIRDLTWNI